MTHVATRVIRLPGDWVLSDADLRVNYYDFRRTRLSPSTDVVHGNALIYRTNALGCRGDDIRPGLPVVALVGGDFVHGGRSGGGLDAVRVDGVSLLNAGVEGLCIADCATRAEEVAAAVPLSGLVLVPPLHPSEAETLDAVLDDALTRLAALSPVAVLLPPAIDRRLANAATAACMRHSIPVVRSAPERAGLFGKAARLFGGGPPANGADTALTKALEAQVAALVALAGSTPQAVATAADSSAKGDFGPESVGRTYPLW